MRLRILLTDGQRTVDLFWLIHNGTDIYYGAVGDNWKDSYHASGKRHMKSLNGGYGKIESHHPLEDLIEQMQLITFAFSTNIVRSSNAAEFSGKKADVFTFLDSRTLPAQVNVAVGLLEPGNYSAMLPVHLVSDLKQVVFITSTRPWIYVMVTDPASVESYLEHMARRKMV